MKRTLLTLKIINTWYNWYKFPFMSHTLYLNLTLEILNTNYITNSHLSANPIPLYRLFCKEMEEIPAHKIIQNYSRLRIDAEKKTWSWNISTKNFTNFPSLLSITIYQIYINLSNNIYIIIHQSRNKITRKIQRKLFTQTPSSVRPIA